MTNPSASPISSPTTPATPPATAAPTTTADPATPATTPTASASPADCVIAAFISEDPLEGVLADAQRATTTSQVGALVQFLGIVRDHDGGQSVAALSYSCHPDAQKYLERIAQEVAQEFSSQVRLWTAHRVGDLVIGELAFVVLAASAHRAEAYAAASMLTDRVKAEVPIWKRQTLSDGSIQWSGIE